MESTRCVCSLLLLTMSVLSSGRSATEYFQQAGLRYSPVVPEDTFVLFTALAPPLTCEPEKDGDWLGGNATEASFRLILPDAFTDYACTFEGNATWRDNLSLLDKSVPRVFTSRGTGIRDFTKPDLYCTTDSQLPDEYFHMIIQRPHEERPVKCRLHREGLTLYVKFPGYPTIICQIFITESRYLFSLPGIVEEPYKCVFRVYSELRLVNTHTEERLHRSLISSFPRPIDGAPPRFLCSRHATSNGTSHFQLRLPGGSIYDCSFSDA